jgi:hypothetical protein
MLDNAILNRENKYMFVCLCETKCVFFFFWFGEKKLRDDVERRRMIHAALSHRMSAQDLAMTTRFSEEREREREREREKERAKERESTIAQ